jgi:hypothetical protein
MEWRFPPFYKNRLMAFRDSEFSASPLMAAEVGDEKQPLHPPPRAVSAAKFSATRTCSLYWPHSADKAALAFGAGLPI